MELLSTTEITERVSIHLMLCCMLSLFLIIYTDAFRGSTVCGVLNGAGEISGALSNSLYSYRRLNKNAEQWNNVKCTQLSSMGQMPEAATELYSQGGDCCMLSGKPGYRLLKEGDKVPSCQWMILWEDFPDNRGSPVSKDNSRDGNRCDYCALPPLRKIDGNGIFDGRNVVVFGIPGAFTPTCSSKHLPDFERLYDRFAALGIDDVICVTVNDPFVTYAWQKQLDISRVRIIPDASGEFTKKMGRGVYKNNFGFANSELRSWRYAMFVSNGNIVQIFDEPGMQDNSPDDPYGISNATTILNYLEKNLPVKS